MKWFPKMIALLALCSPAFAAPTGVQASYDVFMSGMKVGQMTETYTRNDDHYTLTSTTTPVGLLAVLRPGKIVSTSRGLIGKNGLRPQRYDHTREGDANKESHAEFDWDAMQLTLIHQTQKTQIALPEGTQDRLSAMYQFMFLHLDNAASLDFMMTDGNKLDSYHYAIGSRQKLDTAAGSCDSLYLDSQAKPGESRTEIWLSTQNKLPCKMIITDARGEQILQLLSDLHITP